MHLKRIVVWCRRDLRVDDNPALLAAVSMGKEVIPIYIYAPEEEGQFQPGRCSRWWLKTSLESFDRDLQDLGSKLMCFRNSESIDTLEKLVQEYGVDAVFFNHLYDPISMVRDNEVKQALRSMGVLCKSFNGDMLREPWEVLDEVQAPFSSFEGFWRAHQEVEPPGPVPRPDALPPVVLECADSLDIDTVGIMTEDEELSNDQLMLYWEPGREGALKQLEKFIRLKLKEFSQFKAKTDRNSTSHLSPHLHFGEIGVRTVRKAIVDATSTWDQTTRAMHVQDFFKQLGFREYSRYLSFHFPFTHERSMLEHLRAVPWRYDQTLFKAWRTGNTGYPLVDAGMKEIWSTGWMHNRCRVVCASFLVKHLLLPWQWGLKHYWDALLDADLECDALGWQYCAGCLSDGHLFSEVMNLDEEVKKFDPKGAYVRRWLPVLARLPAQYIHAPWKAPQHILDDAGIELGSDYPFPIVTPDEAQVTLSKAAEVVAKAEVSVGPHSKSGASGPFRPPTQPLPEASSLIWGDNQGDGHSSIASYHDSRAENMFAGENENVLATLREQEHVLHIEHGEQSNVGGILPQKHALSSSGNRDVSTADAQEWPREKRSRNSTL